MAIWSTVIPAVSALLGAIIGIVATQLGEQRRERRQALIHRHDERKAALTQFFADARIVDGLAVLVQRGKADGLDLREPEGRLWGSQLQIELLCSAELRSAVIASRLP
jgi:hypothetical protein